MNDHDLSDEVDERFQTLESKVIHTEYTVDELNTVVTRQQDQIDALTREIKNIRTALAEGADQSIEAREEPPPPHY
jgi:SlyX protein